MGIFSFLTSDGEQQIKINGSVYMILPNNTHILEENYEGYGVFDGVDFFVEIAYFNMKYLNENLLKEIMDFFLKNSDVSDNYDKNKEQKIEMKKRRINKENEELYEKIREAGVSLWYENDKEIRNKLKFPKFVMKIKDNKDKPIKWETLQNSKRDPDQGY